ncbi:hypothetical protein BDK51DRAFT_43957 [Blyttiomyces helicus]|uniref:Orc1-like AAA ATPase domain-containing protein n=1 Tax=Blyttiomyces helicus TaxID=388810 RepID=A0A4P9WC84_9FUNG|nr:hypothetical protein BDK51DRAFT_43957 [Blyttiomyces helicus]|eukprot:RKO90261.1 hypothetical protein BDK51DRAFT_43957 [Blyttiomyces helicus]
MDHPNSESQTPLADELRSIYSVDENAIPPVYVLQTVSRLSGETAAHYHHALAASPRKGSWEKSSSHGDHKKTVSELKPSIVAPGKAWHRWRHLLHASRRLLSSPYPPDDPDASEALADVFLSLLRTQLEEEVSIAVPGPTDRSVLVRRMRSADAVSRSSRVSEGEDKEELAEIVSRIEGWLPLKNIIAIETDWKPQELHVTNDSSQQEYIAELSDSLLRLLTSCVESVAEGVQASATTPHVEEALHHARLTQQYITGSKTGWAAPSFVGRVDPVDHVREYLAAAGRPYCTPPFVVYGPSGAGKAALVCEALARYVEALDSSEPRPVVVVRWVRTTPTSATAAGLMASVCRQVRAAYGAATAPSRGIIDPAALVPSDVPVSHSQLCALFRSTLALARPDRPLVLVLLGVDKLFEADAGRRLGWLPIEDVPPWVRIVLSTTLDEGGPWEAIEPRLTAATRLLHEANVDVPDRLFEHVEGMDLASCEIAMRRWLAQEGRTLQADQKRWVLETVAAQRDPISPLLVRLLHARLRRWTSFHDPPAGKHVKTVPQLIDDALHDFEVVHGRALVARVCTLLWALRDGVSEVEMDDLVGGDRACILSVIELRADPIPHGRPHVVSRVPPVVLSHLIDSLLTVGAIARWSSGANGGPALLRYTHALFRCAVHKRYIADEPNRLRALFSDVASYFSQEEIAGEDPAGGQAVTDNVHRETLRLESGVQVDLVQHTRRNPPQPSDLAAATGSEEDQGAPAVIGHDVAVGRLVGLFEGMEVPGGDADRGGSPPSHPRHRAPSPRRAQSHVPDAEPPSAASAAADASPAGTGVLVPDAARGDAVGPVDFRAVAAGMHEPGGGRRVRRHRGAYCAVFKGESKVVDPHRGRKDRVECWGVTRAGGCRGVGRDSGGSREGYVDAWKPESNLTESLPLFHDSLSCMATSSDGRLLATGSLDGTIKLWDLAQGEEVLILKHTVSLDRKPAVSGLAATATGSVTALGFSHDRSLLLSAASATAHDGSAPTLKLWSLRTGTVVKTFSGAHHGGARICFAGILPPEERRLLSVGTDGLVVIWEVARGKMIRVLPVQKDREGGDWRRKSVVLGESADWRRKSVVLGDMGDGNRKSVGVGDAVDGERKSVMLGVELPAANPWTAGPVKRSTGTGSLRERSGIAAAMSENGCFAFGSTHLTVIDAKWKEFWVKDISIATGNDTGHSLDSLMFSVDSERIFAATSVSRQNAEKLIASLAADGEAGRIRMSEGGLGTGLVGDIGIGMIEGQALRVKHGTIRAWDILTGDLVLAFSILEQITSLSFCGDRQNLIYGTCRGSIVGRSAETGALLFSRTGHANGIVAVSGLGASRDRLRKGTGGEEGGHGVSGHGAGAGGYGNGGHHFVSAGADGHVQSWALDIEASVGFAPVTWCSFSTTGHRLVTIGGAPLEISDGVEIEMSSQGAASGRTTLSPLRVWDCENGRCLFRWEAPRGEIPVYASFLPGDTERLLVGCSNGLVNVLSITRDAQVEVEFWAEAETAWSQAVQGTASEWPYAATGTEVVAYALHPSENVLAVAICGKERPEGHKQNGQRDKDERRGRFDGDAADAESEKQTTFHESTQDRSSRSLRDLTRVTFWDLTGTPFVVDEPLEFCLLSDATSRHFTGSTTRITTTLIWADDGKTLLISDDDTVAREFDINFCERATRADEDEVHGAPPASIGISPTRASIHVGVVPPWFDEDTAACGIAPRPATCIGSSRAAAATHLCCGFGNGVVAWRHDGGEGSADSAPYRDRTRTTAADGNMPLPPHDDTDVSASEAATKYLIAHQGAGLVACGYAAGTRRSPSGGVVFSVGEDGSVLVQDPRERTITGLFQAGRPLRSAAVCPRSAAEVVEGVFRLALGGANGDISVVRYRS